MVATVLSHQHQQFNLLKGVVAEKAMSLDSYFCKGVRGVVLIRFYRKQGSEPSRSPGAQLIDTEPGLATSTLTLAPSSFPPDNQHSHQKY